MAAVIHPRHRHHFNHAQHLNHAQHSDQAQHFNQVIQPANTRIPIAGSRARS